VTARTANRYVRTRVERGEIRPSTAKAYRDVLRLFAEVHTGPPEKITRRTIERWMATMSDLPPGTRRTRWSIVRGFLAWLRTEGILTNDPMRGMQAPKVPKAVHRALAGDTAAALLDACANPRDELIVTLGLQLGLRRGEIARLEVGSFSPDLMTVTVDGKGGHARLLPTTNATRRALRRYTSWAGINAGPLIRGDKYPQRPVNPDWVGRQVQRIAYDAGVKVRPHDGVATHAMRHTAATDVYQRTRDVLVVQQMLGHGSLQTTQLYVRGMDLSGMREAMEGRSYDSAEGTVVPLPIASDVYRPPQQRAA
jgi:integrase/recombinase XerC